MKRKKKKEMPHSIRFLYLNYIAGMDGFDKEWFIDSMSRMILRNKYKPDIKSVSAAIKFMEKYDRCPKKR